MSGQPKKIAGVLGGMGPDATVDFMATVVALTAAETDQDHIRMLVDHNPQVPDRQAALSGDRTAVSEVLAGMAVRLQESGADFLVMPCNTAYVFADKAIASVSIPFLSIIEETVSAIGPDTRIVGVLATTACLQAGAYQEKLEAGGRRVLLPDEAGQEILMKLIRRVKAADRGSDVRAAMSEVAAKLVQNGAQAIIAGCTEIPIVLGQADVNVPLFSSTGILARRTVEVASGQP
jgi:aspartate racemase